MNLFYLVSIIIGITSQNVFKKIYSEKNGKSVYLFNVMTSLSAMTFFVASSLVIKGGLNWKVEMKII